MVIPTQAYSHTHPEAGGLVLCADCAAEAIAAGKSHALTQAELQPLWNFPITVNNPVHCDNCSTPVAAADTPLGTPAHQSLGARPGQASAAGVPHMTLNCICCGEPIEDEGSEMCRRCTLDECQP